MGPMRAADSERRQRSRLVWLPLAALLALATAIPAHAQETPEPTPQQTAQQTPEPTPQQTPQEPVAEIRIEPPPEPVDVGNEFEVQVLVEDVEHLASFDFAIKYDPDRVSFERMSDVGTFLASGEREGMICGDPMVRDSIVSVSCITPGPPLCLDGKAGPSGSGLLARLVFKAEGSGTTTLELTDPTHLVLDDVQPCNPGEGEAVQIPLRRQNATVELEGGGFPWLIVGPIIGLVVLVLIGGAGAYLRSRRSGRESLA